MSNDEWFVTMPKLGETVTEGELTNWLKQVGDKIEFDDPLFEVSTDKVDSEIPSPYDGVIAEILVQAGETVPVGTQLVRITAVAETPASPDNRLPSASHHNAAAGGPALGNPAAPQMGGSEGPVDEDGGLSVPTGIVHDITMPKLGETVTEGTIGSWLKAAGDAIEMDDPLFEVSTDKVDSEIPSPYDGVLLEILVPAGETVPVGTPLARIGEAGTTAPAPSGSTPDAVSAPVPGAGSGSSNGSRAMAAPVAGDRGSDAVAAGPTAGSRELARCERPCRHRCRRPDPSGGCRKGTGQRRHHDARAAATGDGSGCDSGAGRGRAPAAAQTQPIPAGTNDPRDETVTLSRMRLAVAGGMMASLANSASVWTSIEVDFDNVEKIRRKYKDQFKKETGASLSYLPFVSRATIDALRAFPTVNSSIDIEAKTMTLHPYVNLGIAVDLDQQGLVVPVVKDADGLNMRGVAKRITELAGAARGKKLGSEDMKGSTFTITNPGPFASYASSPIINQPNVAILCTDGVKRRPVAVGDAIAIHPTGIIGLVYDHRAFDGSTASLFLMHIRDSLEQRNWEPEVL